MYKYKDINKLKLEIKQYMSYHYTEEDIFDLTAHHFWREIEGHPQAPEIMKFIEECSKTITGMLPKLKKENINKVYVELSRINY